MSAAPRSPETGPQLFAFDLARATAAVAVVFSHARDLILVDAGAQPGLSPVGRAFYGLSGLGHQAVIVFFVISGFLVTRSMRRAADANRWSLTSFALARLTRLWVVLLPCLVLGAVFDRIGLLGVGEATDLRDYGALTSGAPSGPPALDAATFLGNTLFLQTVAVRPFGSNGALWSLANEAWYYALAALAYAAWRWRIAPLKAAGCVVGLVLSVAVLPASILALAPVWACGAGLALLESKSTTPRPLTVGASGIAFAAVLVMARCRAGQPACLDLLLGLAATCLLWCGLHRQAGAGRWCRAVQVVSRLSYSLYLSHLPLLVLATRMVLRGHRQPFGLSGVSWVVTAVGLALAFAAGVWWCFERHTAFVRALVFAAAMRGTGRSGFRLRATAEGEAAS